MAPDQLAVHGRWASHMFLLWTRNANDSMTCILDHSFSTYYRQKPPKQSSQMASRYIKPYYTIFNPRFICEVDSSLSRFSLYAVAVTCDVFWPLLGRFIRQGAADPDQCLAAEGLSQERFPDRNDLADEGVKLSHDFPPIHGYTWYHGAVLEGFSFQWLKLLVGQLRKLFQHCVIGRV